MGVVPMKEVSSFLSHGDVCCTYAVYIYCDNCGSFAIQKKLSVRQWLLIIMICLFLTAIVFLFGRYRFDVVDRIILLLCLLIPVVLTYVFWGAPAYLCKKCESLTTIRYNTRDYPSEDLSIVDVPDQQIQQYFLRGWPEDQPIEAYLNPRGGVRHW